MQNGINLISTGVLIVITWVFKDIVQESATQHVV